MNLTILREGREWRIDADSGLPLSTYLRQIGLKLAFPCGGHGTCKKCLIQVQGTVSKPDAEELAGLTEKQLAEGWRLACRTKILGDAVVRLSQQAQMYAIAAGQTCPMAVSGGRYTQYGLSVDIGTTTLCAQLYAPVGELARAVCTNPQAAFGGDVVSRLEAALAGKSDVLQSLLWAALAKLTAEVTAEAGVLLTEVDGAVITGNTAMLYLLTGKNPATLATAPFVAEHLFGETISCREWCNQPAPLWETVYFPRCISAFVGADITTALFASRLCGLEETALLVDIGTNGEMALWTKGKLRCCSTAAGPAFEGGGLSQGVCGISGAVDHVWVEKGALRFHTIDEAPPIGICGSGIIDAIASMLALCILDETGAFCTERESFEVAPGVSITQEDIRMIQLAKGAIRAGMETLLLTEQITPENVSRFYLAGGFGSYLRLESAADIGLLPPSWLERTTVLGNAAHTGATMLLQDQSLASKTDHIAKIAETIPLHNNPIFTDYFMEFMLF